MKLLLWNKGEKEFTQFKEEGLCLLNSDDLQLLYDFNEIDSSGVPDIFAHPLIFSYKLDKSNHQNRLPAFQQFSTLIKGLFLGTIEAVSLPMENLDFLGSVAAKFQTKQAVMKHFTVLKWGNRVIGGIYPACLVFPSIRLTQHTLDLIENENRKKLRKFGSGVVLYLFNQWFSEITKPFRQRGNILPLWAQKLSNIIDDWGEQPIPSQYKLKSIEAHFEVLDVGGALATISAKCMEDIGFCRRVVRFKDKNGNYKLPDFPVRLEEIQSINMAKHQTNELPEIETNGDEVSAEFQIWLNNQQHPITHKAEIIDSDQSSILLWPNFTAPNWNINYVLFHASPGFQRKDPYIRVMTYNGNIKEEYISGSTYGRKCFNEPVKYVEICIYNEDTEEYESLGTFKDNRHEFSDITKQETAMLSLDFGTSNTSLAVKNFGSHEFIFKDQTFDLLNGELDKALILEQCIWFPTYGADEIMALSEHNFTSIPSELSFEYIVDMGKKHSGSSMSSHRDFDRKATAQDLESPIEKYTIPHPAYNKENAFQYTVSNFKWDDPFNSYKSQIVNEYYGQTVKAYLKLILQMALAWVRSEPQKNHITLVATYPLAFDKARYDGYYELLSKEICEELSQETGMNIKLPPSRKQISESDAALGSLSDLDYQIIVDIGGSTTDITLSRNSELLMVDSVEYAGNTFVELLTNDYYWPEKLIKGRNFTKREKEIILNRVIRQKGFREGVLPAYGDKSKRDIVVRKLIMFFEVLFHYIELILQANGANDSSEQISFYPFGNGWEFVKAIKSYSLDDYIESYFESRGFNVKVAGIGKFQKAATRKGTVSVGALEMSGEELRFNKRFKGAIRTVVGCDAQIAFGNDSPKKVKATHKIPFSLSQTFQKSQRNGSAIGQGSIFFDKNIRPLLSTKEFIHALSLARHEDVKDIDIIQDFNGACQKKAITLIEPATDWKLTKSLYAVFLEEIFPKYYLNS